MDAFLEEARRVTGFTEWTEIEGNWVIQLRLDDLAEEGKVLVRRKKLVTTGKISASEGSLSASYRARHLKTWKCSLPDNVAAIREIKKKWNDGGYLTITIIV
ncbi:uncharacterized protein LOC126742631 [Anthonomus grandis grandis]|uniref:uncharacterized protein LOC126742631 n=1 Tax=Anthonomus grandis grandis TaxID=2921223 RepID=UPI002166BDC1|nr:uncharacterized protein LOC126742631 [Anthonomus grandis grandis]